MTTQLQEIFVDLILLRTVKKSFFIEHRFYKKQHMSAFERMIARHLDTLRQLASNHCKVSNPVDAYPTVEKVHTALKQASQGQASQASQGQASQASQGFGIPSDGQEPTPKGVLMNGCTHCKAMQAQACYIGRVRRSVGRVRLPPLRRNAEHR